MDELTRFLNVWEQETAKTAKLLNCLPRDQYDFRPDAGGRSLGEPAWHLAEGDATSRTASSAASSISGPSPPASSGPEQSKSSRRRSSACTATPSSASRNSSPRISTGRLRSSQWGRSRFRRSAVELRADARHPSSRPARADVPALRGTPVGVFGPTREQMPARPAAAVQ